MAKLRVFLVEEGVLFEYPVDCAAIDVGVHLWVKIENKKQVVGARVWFQAKGLHDTTVTKTDWDEADAVISRHPRWIMFAIGITHPSPSTWLSTSSPLTYSWPSTSGIL